MTTARAINKQKRRERILAEARMVIARQGFDALKLRDLADMSGVTVPTIYNLIGNKEEVLKALMMGAFADFESEMEKQPPAPASELPVIMVKTLIRMISRNEEFYRATGLASERVENEPGKPENYGLKRVPLRALAGDLCRRALEEGLLKGDIESESLVEQIMAQYLIAFRDWVHQIITLADLEILSLRGFYIPLAADATDSFRAQLVMQLKALRPSSDTRE